MSAAAIFASQFAYEHIPVRTAVPISRHVGHAFNMIGLMLAGAWPETQVLRSRLPNHGGTPD